VRATLPLRPALRTPACPGFGVSGDRKIACFDRSCRRGGISPEWRLPVLPGGWDRTQADDAARRERTLGRGFERVQMGVVGGQILDALHGRGSALPIERVQMDWESMGSGAGEPCPLGSFERVQMAPVLALCVAREPSTPRGSHRLIRRALDSHPASWLRPMNAVSTTQIITGERLCHP
jgi:hypothetical protein